MAVKISSELLQVNESKTKRVEYTKKIWMLQHDHKNQRMKIIKIFVQWLSVIIFMLYENHYLYENLIFNFK